MSSAGRTVRRGARHTPVTRLREGDRLAWASELRLPARSLVGYGPGSFKVPPTAIDLLARRRRGKLVLVTAMTPTPRGEGKTITAIGLAMALHRGGHPAIPCLRQPSLGPVFGVKGGATGGGRATVEPSDEINLGFTGDLYALASAQNLLAALVDNHLHHGNTLDLDPNRIFLPRTLDMNDRALRRVQVGIDPAIGPSRSDRFVITAACELASVHVLSRGFPDLQRRLSRILIGVDRTGRPVRARALAADGAMASILRWAMAPNLVATSEGTPALVHGGPFANLGVGTATTLSIRLALACAEYAIVEAGFGSDLGAEKFIDLVAPAAGFSVDAVVLVVTVAGLRRQGGGTPDPSASDLPAIERGFLNLDHHLSVLERLGLAPVVAVNRHPRDGPEEVAAITRRLADRGVPYAVTEVFRRGSAGALELADLVRASAAQGRRSRPLTRPRQPLEDQLEAIARSIYGADSVEYTAEARESLAALDGYGLRSAGVCVAKTPLSLGDDPSAIGGPTGAPIHVRSLDPWGGARLVVARLGPVVAMPGLPESPAAARISIGPRGDVRGVL